jgi:hypothetical protein
VLNLKLVVVRIVKKRNVLKLFRLGIKEKALEMSGVKTVLKSMIESDTKNKLPK